MRVPRIYAIADQDAFGGERLPEVASALAGAGVGWIQLRIKRAAGADLFRWVEASVRRLEGSDARLWIDDRADVAALFPVFGVHVGQDDLPPAAVRRAAGSGPRIGRSTHDEAQLRAADADPEVDVVAFGPVFATRSKGRPDPVVGVELLRRARTWTAKPLVAIGGIDARNLVEVLAAGVDAVAVISALGGESSSVAEIAKNARRLLAEAGQGEESR